MKRFSFLPVLFAMICPPLHGEISPEPPPSRGDFLRADGQRLFFGDQEYRAVGVNIPYASRVFIYRMEGVATEDFQVRPVQEMVDVITDAANQGFSFLRMFAYPNSPHEIEWYLSNKELYWKRMDALFELCRKLGLKLIPSLGMYPNAHYRPYTKENNPEILNPKSKTHELIYGYVAEMVNRYRDDPIVLMWEITNEAFLKADVRPPGTTDPADVMTFAQFQEFYREAAAFIKKHAPNHLVTSGDAHVRKESLSLALGRPSKMDSLREHLANLLLSQPEPIDVISIHAYGPTQGRDKLKGRLLDSEGYLMMPGMIRMTEYLKAKIQAAHAARSPVFAGEIGQSYPYFNEDPSTKWTLDAIDLMDEQGVSLIALWAWRFPEQPHHTFDAASHPALVERARTFNAKYGALPKP